MDLHRPVVFPGRGFSPSALPEVEDVRLDGPQEGAFAAVDVKVALLAAQFIEEGKEVASQGAHRGEQAVSLLQVELARRGAGCLQPPFGEGYLPVRGDVRPVLPAGVHQKQVDVGEACHCPQHLEVVWGEGRDAEDGKAPRETVEGGRRVIYECPQQPCPMRHVFTFRDLPPEGRLPMALPPPLPLEDHVGAEGQVLVEEVGDARRKLKELEVRKTVPEIGL